jgi:hypothetical protein
MHILVPRRETALNISGFLLTVEYGYYIEGGWNFKAKYAECMAASKVFNRPRPKMALYRYSMYTTSKIMYSMRGFFGGAKGNRQCYYSDGLDSLVAEAIEGLRWLLEVLLVITHFLRRWIERVFLPGYHC